MDEIEKLAIEVESLKKRVEKIFSRLESLDKEFKKRKSLSNILNILSEQDDMLQLRDRI